jgi:hypothetical protein
MDKTREVAEALPSWRRGKASASGGAVSIRRRRTKSWKRLEPPLLRLSKTANRAAGVVTDPEAVRNWYRTNATRRPLTHVFGAFELGI